MTLLSYYTTTAITSTSRIPRGLCRRQTEGNSGARLARHPPLLPTAHACLFFFPAAIQSTSYHSLPVDPKPGSGIQFLKCTLLGPTWLQEGLKKVSPSLPPQFLIWLICWGEGPSGTFGELHVHQIRTVLRCQKMLSVPGAELLHNPQSCMPQGAGGHISTTSQS